MRSFDEVKGDILAELRKRAIDDNRAAATRDIFSDPTLKVDKDLIERIYVEGANATQAIHAPPAEALKRPDSVSACGANAAGDHNGAHMST